jgi:hypothetical protein
MMRAVFTSRFRRATLQDYCVTIEQAEGPCTIANTKRRVKAGHDPDYDR